MNEPTLFNKVFQHRIRDARRQRTNMSQQKMAMARGVSEDAYKKWENRANAMMPLHCVTRFAVITGRSVEDLLSPVATGDEMDAVGHDQARRAG